jgi:hypothetical protein
VLENKVFLMHRVELKVAREIVSVLFKEKFLMHRVELKGECLTIFLENL